MRIIPTTLAPHRRMLRLHSRTTQRALHFTISPVIARRTYVYVRTETYIHVRRFHAAEDEIHPVYVRRIYEVDISYAAVRPHTISDRCLWPDTILRRTPHIFLPVTFIPRILINRNLGHRCASTYILLVSCCVYNKSATYDRVSLNSMMKPMLFN